MGVEVNSDIDSLLADLALAKTNEENAKRHRIAAEEKILEQFDLSDKERKTVKGTNGLTVTMQTGLTYKLDKDFPENMPIKITKKLDEKEYEFIRAENPKVFAELSQYVTVSQKKPSVTLKVG